MSEPNRIPEWRVVVTFDSETNANTLAANLTREGWPCKVEGPYGQPAEPADVDKVTAADFPTGRPKHGQVVFVAPSYAEMRSDGNPTCAVAFEELIHTLDDVPVGCTIWSTSRLQDADGEIRFQKGGTVVDSWISEDGEPTFKVAYPWQGRVDYAEIPLSEVDQAAFSGLRNVRTLRGLAQAMREDDAKHRTDRHLHALLVLSNVITQISPQRNTRR